MTNKKFKLTAAAVALAACAAAQPVSASAADELPDAFPEQDAVVQPKKAPAADTAEINDTVSPSAADAAQDTTPGDDSDPAEEPQPALPVLGPKDTVAYPPAETVQNPDGSTTETTEGPVTDGATGKDKGTADKTETRTDESSTTYDPAGTVVDKTTTENPDGSVTETTTTVSQGTTTTTTTVEGSASSSTSKTETTPKDELDADEELKDITVDWSTGKGAEVGGNYIVTGESELSEDGNSRQLTLTKVTHETGSMAGQDIAKLIDAGYVDNGDGTYTVKNVTGDLTVTGKRTAKQYPITVDGNAKSCIRVADTVPYGTDYDFTAEELETDKYDYTLTMTINGKPYTPEFDDSYVSFMNTYFYTIKGDAITGNIHITFTQTEKGGAETTTVNFTGSGAADVAGGNPQTATTGANFTFTVNEDAKYNYTVKLGDEVLTGTNGSYTIPGVKVVSGTITVTVEKTVSTQGVKVQKYVKLENQQSVWLVTVEADPGANNVYTYGGERMFKTTKYGTNGTYAYLVIAPTLSVEDAAAQLSITAGEAAGMVSYGGDVNGSGVVDINDAQLVYDMYNAHYASFSDVAMYKFLCADIADDTPEGSTLLNVSDAVAVISKINQQ